MASDDEILRLTSFFTPENIIIYTSSSSTDEITEDLLKNLALTYGIGNVNQILNGYISRNGGLTPISIDDEAVVEHFRLSTIKEVRIALAIIGEGAKVAHENRSFKFHFFFLIITPTERPDLYLRVKSVLPSFISDKKLLENILHNPEANFIWDLIDQKNLHIPGYIVAGDIMVEPKMLIDENSNLENAIDLFINSKALSIPVVDKAGDLMGEVTIQELMNVCFPRYILWMDDMRPVLNFESFRNLLINEPNTWLDEIINHDIARVQVTDPAVRAGIEMTKLSANHAYVLRDNKLEGIIPVQRFINNILRE